MKIDRGLALPRLLTLFGAIATLGAASLDGAPPAGAPVRFWGEVLGRCPSSLEVAIIPSAGRSPVLTGAATLSAGAHGTFFSVEWSRTRYAAALLDAPDPRLVFQSRGRTLTTSSVPVGPPAPLPVVVHMVDGRPRFPQGRIVIARALLKREPELHLELSAAIAWFGETTPGTMRWIPRGPLPRQEAPLTLAARGVTSSLITVPVSNTGSVPASWSALWVPRRPGPTLHRLAMVLVNDETVVDRIVPGPALPDAPVLEWYSGCYPLALSRTTVRAGDLVRLDFETSLAPESEVRRALGHFSLSSPPGPDWKPPVHSFRLDLSEVYPLPGGGSWVAVRSFCPRDVTLETPALLGPEGVRLAGTWRLRSLDHHTLHSQGRGY